jgi:predicted transcriptional regulator of viral defense system
VNTQKTLGSLGSELLLQLSTQGQTIFSTRDAQAIVGTASAGPLLSSLVRKGWLVRLVRGKYLIVPLEASLDAVPVVNRYVIAREVLDSVPHYVSHHSALTLHGLLAEARDEVCITVARRRRSRAIAGVAYHFVYASAPYFWGDTALEVADGERVRVSDVEKTLLDCVVRPELCGGIATVGRALWTCRARLDQARLVAYVERLEHHTAAKRLGLLLETLDVGASETLAALQALVNAHYSRLDPTLPNEGTYLARWRLRVNVDMAALKVALSAEVARE